MCPCMSSRQLPTTRASHRLLPCRELPAVRSLFEAHAATPFSPSGSPAGHPSLPLAAAPSPPLHLVGQQERAAQAGAAALRLVQSTPVPHEAAAQLLAELAPEARFASSPGPGHSETAAGGGPSQGLPRQAQQPSGAQSRAGPGGGGKAQAAPSAGTRGGGGGATAGRAGAQPPQVLLPPWPLPHAPSLASMRPGLSCCSDQPAPPAHHCTLAGRVWEHPAGSGT